MSYGYDAFIRKQVGYARKVVTHGHKYQPSLVDLAWRVLRRHGAKS